MFFIFSALSSIAQEYIDGPANIRKEPNGEVVLSINNNVNIDTWESLKYWRKIVLYGYVTVTSINNNILLKGSDICDNNLKIIGKCIGDVSITIDKNAVKKDGFTRIIITGYTFKSNIKKLNFDEISKTKDVIFSDSSEGKVMIFEDNGTKYLQSKEVNYLMSSNWIADNLVDMVIKTVKTTRHALDSEGSDSQVELTFYPNLDKSRQFKITKSADEFWLNDKCLISKKYGCCGAEDYYELSTFPGNQTFLEFNTSYLYITVPNTNNKMFFGINMDAADNDKSETLVCEFNYSLNSSKPEKILFRAKNKEVRKAILPFRPDFELISLSSKDEIHVDTEYSSMTAWSLNGIKDVSQLSGVGVKVTFVDEENGKKKEYLLMLTGGKFEQKEIIIDF